MQVEREKSRVEPLINENGFASWQSAMQRTENEGKRTLHVGTEGQFFQTFELAVSHVVRPIFHIHAIAFISGWSAICRLLLKLVEP